MTQTYLTKKGVEKLCAEQKSLLKDKFRVTEEVNKAAALGDLRENAEYHAAREKLQQISRRLLELDAKLSNVKLTDDLQIKAGEARVGTTVSLEDQQFKDRFSYQLVGSDEADPADGKISIESPLGKSLLGQKKGAIVNVNLPRGKASYKVLKVERTTDG